MIKGIRLSGEDGGAAIRGFGGREGLVTGEREFALALLRFMKRVKQGKRSERRRMDMTGTALHEPLTHICQRRGSEKGGPALI